MVSMQDNVATAAVEVKGLVKIYKPDVRALDGIDLAVPPGSLFALLGPNGAGKTTLMRILTTQLAPNAGEARVFGLDVVRRASDVRRLIGYIPQEMSVWTDITGYENLLIYSKIYGIPARDRGERIRDALESMGLTDVAGAMVKTYSGGMIRRLEVACALLINPRILFLDEPTIGLDPSARRAVWEKILTFRREFGTTVFFNTHYMDEADLYSDQIAIIDRGRMVKIGTAEALKRSIRRDVVRVAFQGAPPAAALLPEVQEVLLENSELAVAATDAEAALPAVIEVLAKGGVSIQRAAAAKPTLDDVFQAYAGTTLSSGGDLRSVRQFRRRIKKG
jgi:ABC-2 type transport system ATP-binding protein